MSCLVTGAAGFLGREVADRLAAEGISVTRTDMIGSDRDIRPCDLSDRAAVDSLVSDVRPSRIIHCGAISGPMLAKEDPRLIFEVNAAGTWNLLDAAKRARVSRFILTSSICVYGKAANRDAVTEHHRLDASDPYGSSKICAEQILHTYLTDFGLDGAALRISSIYGPGRATPCLIKELVASSRGGTPATLYNNGRTIRQFVHIRDAANAVVRAATAERLNQASYNVAGGLFVPEIEIARKVQALLPAISFEISLAPGDFPDGDIGPLSLEAANRDFGYSPTVPFEEGLAEYIAYLTKA
jgi:UDP-glucuronate 4-epimerase